MKKILLVGSQHGNELLGIRLYEYVAEKRPPLLEGIEYYCANPLAFALNKRFLEADMNRSYARSSSGYEAERAKELTKKIHSSNYKYIIDCHTTTTEVGMCFIIKARNATLDEVINATPKITDIVLMKEEIANLSLLEVSTNVIAIEVNEKIATEEATLNVLLKMIEQLLEGKVLSPAPRSVYSIDSFIDSTADFSKDKELHNFKEYNGQYPILCGGDLRNRTYRGFWATKQPDALI